MPIRGQLEQALPRREEYEHRGRPFLRITLPDAAPEAPAFAIAQALAGRFRVGDFVSAGEISVIFRGIDGRTSQDVIIKALRPDAIRIPPPHDADPEAWTQEIRRLRHLLQVERRLLVRLRVAGCLTVPLPVEYVYDRNPSWEGGSPALHPEIAETEPYLILEAISGESLERLIAARYPDGMDETEALVLLLPIVRTLATLHEPWTVANGRVWHCIYQDLKPANILVEPGGAPRLVDFGGCQVVINGTPVLEGSHTPGYSAPEGEGTSRVLLPAADVYTIGTTLVHMLSGLDPRERRPGTRPDAGLPGRVSAGVRDLVARCLAPLPSDRIADAEQVARAMGRLLDQGDTRRLAPSP